MSPLSQTRILMPLLERIRQHLAQGEYASFKSTSYGSPYIEARTERDRMIAYIEGGLVMLEAAQGKYACDPTASKDAVNNAIRRALNAAREEWS